MSYVCCSCQGTDVQRLKQQKLGSAALPYIDQRIKIAIKGPAAQGVKRVWNIRTWR